MLLRPKKSTIAMAGMCRWLPALVTGIRAFVLMAAVLGSQPGMLGAAARDRGQTIYRKQCAECHGRAGEGVKGKYDSPLQGDWSLEKLVRIIDRTMPEGAPETCVGEDAQAVGRYVYDTFYSKEARAKRHPARVELVRLTNRQYQNTVADLLRRFGEADRPVKEGSDRGLSGVYYNARGFSNDKRVMERVDAAIDFDFGQGSPAEGKIGAEEFSMRWQGSVLAPDTGEYEFVLRSPNGVRLWVNGNEPPLIDAWVASGTNREHRVTLRLLGGRLYPIQLDFFKFKDKAASIALMWKPPHGVLGPVMASHLRPHRSRPTFVVTTQFPPDDSSVGYERGVLVSKAWDEATTQAAIEVAGRVAGSIDQLAGTKPEAVDRLSRIEAFCNRFVAAAFRRPLTPEQQRQFVAVHFGRAGGKESVEDSVKRVVLLALKSPRFLYLGLGGAGDEGYRVAERLSYALWDSLPDKELEGAAAAGRLGDEAGVSTEIRRMLTDSRTREKVRGFLHHWLQLDHIDQISKDPAVFPGFTPEVIADLRTSLDLFLERIVWGESSDYRQLLLSNELPLNDRLARFYGIGEGAEGAGFRVATADPAERSGVLTHPYMLAALAYSRTTSPIHRGVFLTRNIIGRALKPPPMAIAFNDAGFSPNLTMREKVVELTRPQACQNCHSVINPLGFGLEHFDAVGRFRTEENGRPVDAVGEYTTDSGEVVVFRRARDIAEFAIRSGEARRTFIELLFHQVVKQPMLAYGVDVMPRLENSFTASGFNVQRLLMEIASMAARHGTTPPASTPRKS